MVEKEGASVVLCRETLDADVEEIREVKTAAVTEENSTKEDLVKS